MLIKKYNIKNIYQQSRNLCVFHCQRSHSRIICKLDINVLYIIKKVNQGVLGTTENGQRKIISKTDLMFF